MERGFERYRTNRINNFIIMMSIYKTVFDTVEQGKAHLLNMGVLIDVDGTTQFSQNTAAVVYVGKVVDKVLTTDQENPIYKDGFAIDIMSSEILDFGNKEVFPTNGAHGFMGV